MIQVYDANGHYAGEVKGNEIRDANGYYAGELKGGSYPEQGGAALLLLLQNMAL